MKTADEGTVLTECFWLPIEIRDWRTKTGKVLDARTALAWSYLAGSADSEFPKRVHFTLTELSLAVRPANNRSSARWIETLEREGLLTEVVRGGPGTWHALLHDPTKEFEHWFAEHPARRPAPK